jgi:hypothetical protein
MVLETVMFNTLGLSAIAVGEFFVRLSRADDAQPFARRQKGHRFIRWPDQFFQLPAVGLAGLGCKA